MAKPMSINLKANLIGIAAFAILGGYYLYGVANPELEKPCSTYYPPSVAINVEKSDGELISAETLQSRSSSQDWGLIDKLKVVRASDAPVPSIFEVFLKKDDVFGVFNKQGGAAFPWQPSRFKEAKSVCVSFNVKLPEDFDFSAEGILPGVASKQVLIRDETDEYDDGELVRKFQAHPAWSRFGRIRFLAYDPTNTSESGQFVIDTRTDLVPGRWHKIEQEIVMNDEGVSNGVVRLWLDGDLVINEAAITLTKKPVKIDTAFYHVSHGTPLGHGKITLTKDSVVRISPMEISWK